MNSIEKILNDFDEDTGGQWDKLTEPTRLKFREYLRSKLKEYRLGIIKEIIEMLDREQPDHLIEAMALIKDLLNKKVNN